MAKTLPILNKDGLKPRSIYSALNPSNDNTITVLEEIEGELDIF